MSRFDDLIHEREDRFVGYIKKNMTRDEIGEREGLESYYVGKMRKEIGQARLGQTKFPETKRDGPVYGLTDATKHLRHELGARLYDLGELKKMHHLEISRDVGIPQRHQNVANGKVDKKMMYNWKLSQIERLAKVLGIDVTKLLIRSLRHELRERARASGASVGKLVEEWIDE